MHCNRTVNPNPNSSLCSFAFIRAKVLGTVHWISTGLALATLNPQSDILGGEALYLALWAYTTLCLSLAGMVALWGVREIPVFSTIVEVLTCHIWL